MFQSCRFLNFKISLFSTFVNFRETRGSLGDIGVAVVPVPTGVLAVAAVPIIWYRVPAVAGVPEISNVPPCVAETLRH